MLYYRKILNLGIFGHRCGNILSFKYLDHPYSSSFRPKSPEPWEPTRCLPRPAPVRESYLIRLGMRSGSRLESLEWTRPWRLAVGNRNLAARREKPRVDRRESLQLQEYLGRLNL